MIQLRKEGTAGVRKAMALGLLLAALMIALLAAMPAAALDNPVQAWGKNDFGELGNGTNGGESTTPVGVSNLGAAKRLDGGCLHSLALKKSGKVYGWGNNEFGQLGALTPDFYSNTPVNVQTSSGKPFGGVKAISVGCLHNLALKENGTVYAWGNNESGQLGNGSKGVGTPDSRPAKVDGLSNIKAVSAGAGFSLALKKDGRVYAWGENIFGQLGNGTNDDSYTPVQVPNLTGVKAIAAGGDVSLALKQDGTVYAWGWNYYGQLGNGTPSAPDSESSTPVQVSNLTDIKAIAVGGTHALALKEDGKVYAWGSNTSGQLGDGTNDESNTPVLVKQFLYFPLTGVKAIAAGRSHSLALKKDGTLRAWGFNDLGQLGDGTNDNRNRPVQVSNLSGIKAIGAGNWHSLAVKK